MLSQNGSRSTCQGCQIGSFGAKNQKFGSFEKQLAPKFLFGYFWLFCNISFHKFFLEKSCEWCVQLVPAIIKLDVGQHTVMFEPDKKSIEHKHTVSAMQIDNNRHRGFLMALG